MKAELVNRLGQLSRERLVLLAAELATRLDALPDREPIAIVGLGCRFPGGGDSPSRFWAGLRSGVDAVTEVPPDRWAPQPGAPRWAGFLSDVKGFDAAFFGIAPREATAMDPQQRLFLEVCYEALDDAGYPPPRVTAMSCGVFAGVYSSDYLHLELAGHEPPDLYSGTGTALNVVAGRVSYVLNLSGPAVALDTACSSSLLAVHQACSSLRNAECDLALAGGVHLLLSPLALEVPHRMGMLAPSGRSRTFDADADGMVIGEGCGAVVLKRLAEARRDGDRIWGVVLGSAVNQDGRSNGLTAPNERAQEDVLRAALRSAGLNAAEVELIEAHGTGTPLGDPIEVDALSAVYGAPADDGSPCYLGSVKTNVGHLGGAAGIAGLIKAVLELWHAEVVPHVHFRHPSPHVRLDGTRFRIATQPTPLPARDGPRRAAVSSFGWSGTNVHVLLEHTPQARRQHGSDGERASRSSVVLPLSAESEAGVGQLVDAYNALLGQAQSVADLAYTAAVRRKHYAYRTFAVGGTPDELRESFAASVHDECAVDGRVVFVYPGQGTQWVGMGRELLASEPRFAEVLDQCDAAIRRHADFSVRELLASAAPIQPIGVVQPTLFAFQMALTAVWRAWGVTPAAVIGHSMGEVAAACVAGVLDLEDAARLISVRSRLLQRIAGKGAMLFVAAEPDRLSMPGELCVAAHNGPAATMLAGEPAALERFAATLAEQGVFCRLIGVDVAAHSPQVDPLLPELVSELNGIQPHAASVPLYSTVGGDGTLDAAYWARNLRQPVEFAAATARAMRDGLQVFLEISPHPALANALPGLALSSLSRGLGGRAALLRTLGRLYQAHYPVDWQRVYPHPGKLVSLPTYPWQREEFWHSVASPSPAMYAPPAPTEDSGHPLLGRVEPISDRLSMYRLTLDQADLRDHRLGEQAICPAAAFVELAMATGARRVRGLTFHQPLRLGSGSPRAAHLVHFDPAFAVWSRTDGGGYPTLHADGETAPPGPPCSPSPLQVEPIVARCAQRFDRAELYEHLRSHGACFGSTFQRIDQLWRRQGEALALITPPEARGAYCLHPALLDACLQPLSAALERFVFPPDGRVFVPSHLEEFTLWRVPRGRVWSHAVVRERAAGSPAGDLAMYDQAGELVAEARGLRLRLVSVHGLEAARAESEVRCLEPAWHPWEANGGRLEPGGRWLLGGGPSGTLADELERAGERVDRGAIANALDPLRGVVWSAPAAEGSGDVQGLLELTQALLGRPWSAPPRLWVLTRGAQTVHPGEAAPALWQAPVWGLTRSILAEHPELRPGLLDLDPETPSGETRQVVDMLLGSGTPSELALRGSRSWVPSLERVLADPLRAVPSGPYRLQLGKPGDPDSVHYTPAERVPPGKHEVEIEVHRSGLIFRDVLLALGVYPEQAPLGAECAGTIVRVGAAVTHVALGDAVMALGGGFARYVTLPADLVVRRPAKLSLAESATIPAAFTAAVYALEHLARIRSGERVLIHSAAGGVGLAAVQLAQRAGAEVVATAGSARKRAYLGEMGVRQVFDSRTPDFARHIREVDVVLNSLVGEAVERSLGLLASGGRFVELGVRDVRRQADLPAGAYLSFNLADVWHAQPEVIRNLLADLVERFERGELRPLPVHTFSAERVTSALRTMQHARHLGKVVVAHDPPWSSGAILITGGLGALGLRTAEWLAERGASRLVLVGRREPSADAAARLAEMREHGVEVVVERCDVADMAGLRDVFARHPVAGVIHAAGTLDDGVVSRLDANQFESVFAAKVRGSWNLHLATRALDVRFFVLFSSIAGFLGSAGQANHAAACAFQEALANHRQALGLPAQCIAWGPWSEVGAAAGARAAARVARSGWLGGMPTDEALAILGEYLDRTGPAVVVLPLRPRSMSDEQQLPSLLQDTFRAHSQAPRRAPQGPASHTLDPRRLDQVVRDELRRVLGFRGGELIPADRGFFELGMDSLTAVEFKNRLQTVLGRTVPVAEVFAHPTVARLAAHLGGVAGHTPSVDTPSGADRVDLPDGVGELSDDEALARLRAG